MLLTFPSTSPEGPLLHSVTWTPRQPQWDIPEQGSILPVSLAWLSPSLQVGWVGRDGQSSFSSVCFSFLIYLSGPCPLMYAFLSGLQA